MILHNRTGILLRTIHEGSSYTDLTHLVDREVGEALKWIKDRYPGLEMKVVGHDRADLKPVIEELYAVATHRGMTPREGASPRLYVVDFETDAQAIDFRVRWC
jgi:hypothetical protein